MTKSIDKNLPIDSREKELILVSALADYRDECRKKHNQKGVELAQSLLDAYLK